MVRAMSWTSSATASGQRTRRRGRVVGSRETSAHQVTGWDESRARGSTSDANESRPAAGPLESRLALSQELVAQAMSLFFEDDSLGLSFHCRIDL